MTETRSAPDWLVKQRQRQEAARGPFEELARPFLDLDTHQTRGERWRIGTKLPVLDRVVRALAALREFRQAHNQRHLGDDEEETLAVRVVADELANQIQHTAPTVGDLDPNTIAWVLAGLRCPNTPFCTGCRGCFTITAPNRPIDGQVGA